LLLGKVEQLGPNGLMSGIAKQPVKHAVWLNSTGFDGDAQADRKRHGGPEKAVHHYPAEHYDLWRREFGDIAILGKPWRLW
jgi:MOSC domain-containing protein YiiM